MRRLLALLTLAVAGLLATAGPVAASGPATEHRPTVTVDCGSAGTFNVFVQPAENANGTGQIVGEKGFGIPVSLNFTVTDVTTNTVLFSDTTQTGKGHGHPNQQTVPCTFNPFQAMDAADFFADQGGLPPGVAPTDLISGLGTVEIILKR